MRKSVLAWIRDIQSQIWQNKMTRETQTNISAPPDWYLISPLFPLSDLCAFGLYCSSFSLPTSSLLPPGCAPTCLLLGMYFSPNHNTRAKRVLGDWSFVLSSFLSDRVNLCHWAIGAASYTINNFFRWWVRSVRLSEKGTEGYKTSYNNCYLTIPV